MGRQPERGPRLHRETYLPLSLSLSSSQGGNAHAHITYLYTKRRLAFPFLVNTLRRHARAMSCLLYHRKDPENRERTKERGNSVLKRS